NLYQILYKDGGCGTLTYGRNSYDYEAGSLLFTAPGQTMQYDQDIEAINPESGDWTLAFHPDLIRKSAIC
ncbi:MAG: AraC family transcriptional regulator, partial [Bacteroidota bacterium]